MTAAIRHTDVAAYALGLLEEPDRRAFETHLACCTECADELLDLTGVTAAGRGRADAAPAVRMNGTEVGVAPVPGYGEVQGR